MMQSSTYLYMTHATKVLTSRSTCAREGQFKTRTYGSEFVGTVICW